MYFDLDLNQRITHGCFFDLFRKIFRFKSGEMKRIAKIKKITKEKEKRERERSNCKQTHVLVISSVSTHAIRALVTSSNVS